MSLNPDSDSSRPITPQNHSSKYSLAGRSVSTQRLSYPKLKIDESQIIIPNKKSLFHGHLFIPQTIHSSIMQTERQRITSKPKPPIPMIGRNRSSLQIGTKHTIESAFKIKKGPLYIKLENDIRKQQYPIEIGRISFKTPIKTERDDSERAKAFTRVYTAPSPLVSRHNRHRSAEICKTDYNEALVYSKGDHITLKDREFYKNIVKKKPPVNLGPRKLSLNSKSVKTYSRDISPIETKRDADKWTCTLSTQHSFMRTFTEETAERHRRLTTEAEGGKYNYRRGRSLSKTRCFRHTTTAMYENSDAKVKIKPPIIEENLWVVNGRPAILNNMNHLKRAEEFLKEGNNIKMEIHNEIDNLTKVIHQRMNIK